MNVDDGSSHGPSDPTARLRRIAALLPLVTVAAWVITIFVPILDSGNNDGPRITATTEHQELATGFPVGKRFKSARVQRNCDANYIHLGHRARADGRWRVYVFADAPVPGNNASSKVTELADWLNADPASPLVRFRRAGEDLDSLLELSVIYQQGHTEFSFPDVPTVFRPHVGEFDLEYVEKIYATLPDEDIFDVRGISRDGAVVVVRPDQYVSGIFPLDAHDEIGSFFDGVFVSEQ